MEGGFRSIGEEDWLILFYSLAIFMFLTIAGRGLLGKKAVLPILPIASLTFIYFIFVIGSVLNSGLSVYSPILILAFFSIIAVVRAPLQIIVRDILYSGIALFFVSPLIWLALVVNQGQWDDYTHWLVSAQYLLREGHLPVAETIVLNHSTPSYPWARAMLHAWVNSQTTSFSFNVQPLFNVLFCSSLLLWGPIWLKYNNGQASLKLTFASMAGYSGLIIILILCLGSNTFMSSYADPIYCVCMVHIFHFICLDYLSDARFSSGSIKLDVSALILFTAPMIIKSSGLYFSIMLLTLIWILRAASQYRQTQFGDLRCLLKSFLVQSAYLIPSFLLYFAWSIYITRELIPLTFTVQPIENWHFDILPTILWSIFQEMQARPYAYIGLLLALFILLKQWRAGQINSLRSNIFLFISVGFFFSSLCFQIVVYCISFGEGEAANAASFNRYMAPSGLMVYVGLFAYLVETLSGRAVTRQIISGVSVMLGFIFLVVYFDQKLAPPQRFPDSFKILGKELKKAVPEGSKLLFLDLLGNGFVPTVVRFYMDGKAIAQYRSSFDVSGTITRQTLSDWSEPYDYIYVLSAPDYVWEYPHIKRRFIPAFYLRDMN